MPEPQPPAASTVRSLSIDRLRTSFAKLRPGESLSAPEQLAELPLRVAPIDDGFFEVIDGFKRLERWREQGSTSVPAVVERPALPVEHKRFLLLANAPPRTTTALDEARVVRSLAEEDGLTPSGIARLLGHKPGWVESRLALGSRLSPAAERRLARRAIGPTLAHALCEQGHKDQDKLLDCAERHGLSAREVLNLVKLFGSADEADRRLLLRDPLGRLRPEPRSAAVSPRSVELERQLQQVRRSRDDRQNVGPHSNPEAGRGSCRGLQP